jgi:PadR family transcriptional regulator, regulatory protein PadR
MPGLLRKRTRPHERICPWLYTYQLRAVAYTMLVLTLMGSLLDGKGESVYSPFYDRREPLTKPVALPQGTLEMLILKAVSLGSLHGYGILLRIQQISGERLEILQGSFYTAIYRLERRGWIQGEWGESENNRRARFYSLTAAGTRQLKAETAKWIDMAAVVAGILDKKADEI